MPKAEEFNIEINFKKSERLSYSSIIKRLIYKPKITIRYLSMLKCKYIGNKIMT
ncbi:hypothetical protein AD06_1432 [Escherichia coli 7-233-03_S4_C2]|nr:hypothetical protein AD06_1432 [Escherichia coli 7-233-03_S4_C2]